MQTLKLVIFDMDGVVFDTETLSWHCYVKTGEVYGFDVSPERFFQLQGRVETDIIKKLVEWYGEKEKILAWREDIKVMRTEMIESTQSVPRIEGIEEVLISLRSQGLATCIASSNFKEAIARYLKYERLEKYFDFFIGKEDVLHGKPDPEVFLKACSIAKVTPDEALVIEDSLAGLSAARSAGIRPLWLPNPLFHPGEIDYEKEDTFKSLKHIDEFIKSRFISPTSFTK